MARLDAALTGLTQGLARTLPPRQFTVQRHVSKSHDGQDHDGPLTIRMGTAAQAMAIGSAVLVAGWLGIATSTMLSNDGDVALAIKQAELARMQAQLAKVKAETAALKGDVAARARELEARQAFLAALLTGKRDMGKLAGMLPRAGGVDAVATVQAMVAPRGKRGKAGTAALAANQSGLIEPFRQLESQQLAFVDKATGAAEAKLRDTQTLLRSLGLDPSRFSAASDWNGRATAVGGPYIPVSADAEPRFKDLFLSWKKLDTMQSALASVPAYMPVKDYRYTSGFGFRYDPFNGGSAMHAGVDMAGAMGEPIYAAANGTVARAGVANGYGNLVELSHGKGIETRYGHLSKILVQPGETVRQGQLIARMGSTGRSTGTHLHYEVRIDGRAVNPRPFLDASAYVLAAQGEAAGPPAPDYAPILADDSVTASAEGARMTPIKAWR